MTEAESANSSGHPPGLRSKWRTNVDHSARPPKTARRTGGIQSITQRAWENLQEIRWVLKDIAGMELPPPARKTIDLEGSLVKDGVRQLSGIDRML
jgi:hypothetical protein